VTKKNALNDADLGFLEHGTNERGADEVTLRFTRRLPHPPAKVWRALTEPEHLAAWFPTTVEGDLEAGAPLRFSFRELNMPGFEGSMRACDPPKLLEFDWGDERLRFELSPDGDGTVLSFSASFAEVGRAARDGAGWHTCLDLLGFELAAGSAPWRQDDRWRQVHSVYVRTFGPEAATIGPPAEWEDAYGPANGEPG
jgi:uncharacterized protein YndB with AHSA1/START domain